MKADYDELVKRLPEIARVVNLFSSDTVQRQAFDLLAGSIGVEPPKDVGRKAAKKVAAEKTPPVGAGKKRRKASGPTLIKDLDLRPKSGVALADFVAQKAPKTNYERSTVAAYYLTNHTGVAAVTADHIYTVYKNAGWKVPPNLANQLQLVASQKGWLDTSSMADITVSIQGENLVDHDLPRATKS